MLILGYLFSLLACYRNNTQFVNSSVHVTRQGASNHEMFFARKNLIDCFFYLGKKGLARKCTENYIILVELVSEKPVLWNHRLSVTARNPIAKNNAWKDILVNFPGKQFITVITLFTSSIICY